MAVKTTYTLSAFDSDRAASGELCAMISQSYSVGTDTTITSDSTDFKGTGICRVNTLNNYLFTLNSVTYSFNQKGVPSSINANGYKLVMAKAQLKITLAGNAIKSSNLTVITRGTGGTVTDVTTTEGDYTTMVDSLNVRDQFAMQALRGILEHIPDPSSLSDSEIAFYCNAAYQWAANMLTQAANARSTVEDTTSTATTETAEVGTLENNTEKLLNNIVAALEKTDASITVDGSTDKVNAERVTIPEIVSILQAYVKNGESTVGLNDLINAIKNLKITSEAKDTISIGNSGLGRNADNPLYISGGGFPSRQVLASAFTSTLINSFLTFNSSGAVGYSTLTETKKALLGYLNDYTSLSTLATAIYNSIKDTIDERIKAWLNAAKVTVDGTEYSLTVNTPS